MRAAFQICLNKKATNTHLWCGLFPVGCLYQENGIRLSRNSCIVEFDDL